MLRNLVGIVAVIGIVGFVAAMLIVSTIREIEAAKKATKATKPAPARRASAVTTGGGAEDSGNILHLIDDSSTSGQPDFGGDMGDMGMGGDASS